MPITDSGHPDHGFRASMERLLVDPLPASSPRRDQAGGDRRGGKEGEGLALFQERPLEHGHGFRGGWIELAAERRGIATAQLFQEDRRLLIVRVLMNGVADDADGVRL